MEDKNRKRAIRRSHYQRLKRKVRWYYDGVFVSGKVNEPNSSEKCGFLVNTRKSCSCWMCGNHRRHYKMVGATPYTIQERKVYQESIDDILRSYEE